MGAGTPIRRARYRRYRRSQQAEADAKYTYIISGACLGVAGGNLEGIFDEIALAKEILAPPGLYYNYYNNAIIQITVINIINKDILLK